MTENEKCIVCSSNKHVCLHHCNPFDLSDTTLLCKSHHSKYDRFLSNIILNPFKEKYNKFLHRYIGTYIGHFDGYSMTYTLNFLFDVHTNLSLFSISLKLQQHHRNIKRKNKRIYLCSISWREYK